MRRPGIRSSRRAQGCQVAGKPKASALSAIWHGRSSELHRACRPAMRGVLSCANRISGDGAALTDTAPLSTRRSDLPMPHTDRNGCEDVVTVVAGMRERADRDLEGACACRACPRLRRRHGPTDRQVVPGSRCSKDVASGRPCGAQEGRFDPSQAPDACVDGVRRTVAFGARDGTIANRRGEPYKPSAIRGYERSLRLRILPAFGRITPGYRSRWPGT